jgi:hypothetical protein
MDFFSILLAHMVGDFVIQNDWMASGKKRSSVICLVHALTYIVPFIILCECNWWQLFLITSQHHLQDRDGFVLWFMKKSGKEIFATVPCAPWSVFAVDATFHLTWIYFIVTL